MQQSKSELAKSIPEALANFDQLPDSAYRPITANDNLVPKCKWLFGAIGFLDEWFGY
jgi:hypothetical protein